MVLSVYDEVKKIQNFEKMRFLRGDRVSPIFLDTNLAIENVESRN